MTAPYDHEALWIKAKVFLNRAMDSNETRSFDEQSLWASLALEVLAKAALARVSPLLIAVPTEEGKNLLIASGLLSGEALFKSVPAKTLFKRCEMAFKPFSFSETETMTHARNEYLHGADAAIAGVAPDAWWPRYWAQASILVSALDKEIEELVGPDRSFLVEAHMEQNKKNVQARVQMKIERAAQRFAQMQAGTLPARVAAEWTTPPRFRAELAHWVNESCPACGSLGVLEGELVESAEPHYEQSSPDDYDAWMDLTVYSEHFSCEDCHLVLSGHQDLAEAGLTEVFEDTGNIEDYIEPDYGND